MAELLIAAFLSPAGCLVVLQLFIRPAAFRFMLKQKNIS